MTTPMRKSVDCHACGQEAASKYCRGCLLAYCEACCNKRHQKGAFQRHVIVHNPLEYDETSEHPTENDLKARLDGQRIDQMGEELSLVLVLCDECMENQALVHCHACELQFCQACSDVIHAHGTMQTHEYNGKLEQLTTKKKRKSVNPIDDEEEDDIKAQAELRSSEVTTFGFDLEHEDDIQEPSLSIEKQSSEDAAYDPWSTWTTRSFTERSGSIDSAPQWRNLRSFSIDAKPKSSESDTAVSLDSISQSLQSLSFATSPETFPQPQRPRSFSDYSGLSSFYPSSSSSSSLSSSMVSELLRAMKTNFASRHVFFQSHQPIDSFRCYRIVHQLQSFGTLATVRDEFLKNGVVFCTFYELKSALAAVKNWFGVLHDCISAMHFALPFELPNETNCATVCVTLHGPAVASTDMRTFCAQFGEVASVLQNDIHASRYIVEYNDARDCDKAITSLQSAFHASGPIAATRTTPPTLDMAKLQLFQDCVDQHHVTTATIHRPKSFSSSSTSMLTSPTSSTSSPMHASSFLESASACLEPSTPATDQPTSPPFTASSPLLSTNGSDLWSSSSPIFEGTASFSSSYYAPPPHQLYLSQHPPPPPPSSRGYMNKYAPTPCFKPFASSSNGRNDQGTGEYSLSLDKVASGQDTRTTLMIRNIPNKYTQQMLLSEINAHHRGQYDFFYLPIDFKNKCNMGYAFINFMDTSHIMAFYNEFNQQKWRNFNSEKVCAISYARLQGKQAMITRFQNSSLLEKHESYRPLVFVSDGPNRGQPEPFPSPQKPVYSTHHGNAHAVKRHHSFVLHAHAPPQYAPYPQYPPPVYEDPNRLYGGPYQTRSSFGSY